MVSIDDAEWILGVGAQFHFRPDRQSDRVGRAGVLGEADPLRIRDLEHVEILLAHGLENGVLEEVLLGIVVDGILGVRIVSPDAQRALQQRPRHLARPESGHLRPAREMAHGFIDLAADLVRGKLDLKDHGGTLRGPRCYLHLPRFGTDHWKHRV